MLLDTSGLMCLHDQADANYAEAQRLYGEVAQKLTHNYVLAEFVALTHARRLARQPALALLAALAQEPQIEIVWVDEQLHGQAMRLLQRQLDKAYSLCDAVSSILMRQRNLTDALTTDHHFIQAGFRQLLK